MIIVLIISLFIIFEGYYYGLNIFLHLHVKRAQWKGAHCSITFHSQLLHNLLLFKLFMARFFHFFASGKQYLCLPSKFPWDSTNVVVVSNSRIYMDLDHIHSKISTIKIRILTPLGRSIHCYKNRNKSREPAINKNVHLIQHILDWHNT